MSAVSETGWRNRRPALVSAIGLIVMICSLWIGNGAVGLCGAALGLIAVGIADIDAREGLIPDTLNVGGFAIGIAHAALSGETGWAGIGEALVRAIVAAGVLWSIREAYQRWRGRDGLGLGDVKLAGVAGLWLDWFPLVLVVELAAVSAILVHGYATFIRRRPMDAALEIPFGLYLAPSIWLGWVYQLQVGTI